MLELISAHPCFGGVQLVYRHESTAIGLPMRFSVFMPPQNPKNDGARLPALFFLAGLTCTEETFAIKAGAQRLAAELGIALVSPDTSPRGANVPGEADDWDFGVGAGFYLNATQEPWKRNWRMESYITTELFSIVTTELSLDAGRIGICGHSMGGHGALVLAQRHPEKFRSVSAFAPIAAATTCPWGQKAFSRYLGEDRTEWEQYDATALMREHGSAPFPEGILVDQGLGDKFLAEQLYPDAFAQACEAVGQPLVLRKHEGYDHGYFFISTFIDDHLKHHARILNDSSFL